MKGNRAWLLIAGVLFWVSMLGLRAQQAPYLHPDLGPPGVAVEWVSVEPGDTIGKLLVARNVEPDGNALATVYTLNPELERLAPLTPGSKVALPILSDFADGRPQDPVRLSLVPEVKRDLLAVSESLNGLVNSLGKVSSTRFGSQEEKEAVIGALNGIRSYLDELNLLVQENRLPLGPELLRESLAETRAVQQSLEATAWHDKALDKEGRELIVGVAEDLSLKARSFDEIRGPDGPMRWRDVKVVVNVFELTGRRPVSNLRVFYANEHFKDRPEWARPFPGVGSRVEDRLLEADYVFWAAKVGDSRPVTEKIPRAVRKRQDQQEVEIDLPVRP